MFQAIVERFQEKRPGLIALAHLVTALTEGIVLIIMETVKIDRKEAHFNGEAKRFLQ
jgi:hypothetical protein